MITDITTPIPYPDKVRVFPVRGKSLLSIGRGSYIVRSYVEHDEAVSSNILVGHFSSIANDNRFLVGINHPMCGLSTYPMEMLEQSDEEWTAWLGARRSREWADPKCQIIIGHDVWIGRGCTIMGGVHIGNGACVAAGALVSKDVPPYALVGGCPAKVIRYRFPEETIRRLQLIKWWYWPKEKIKSIVGDVKTPEGVIRFANEHDAIPLPPVNEQLDGYRKQGFRIFYFNPGTEGERLLPHVLEEFHGSFTVEDKACLVVDTTGHEEGYQAMIDETASRFGKGNIVLPVLTVPGSLPLDLLQAADFLLTTRDFSSVAYSDFVSDFGGKLLYALEEHPFASIEK